MLSPSQKGVRRGAAAGVAITAGSLALALALLGFHAEALTYTC